MPDIAGYDHSWFIVTRKIIEREFALSGWEQNPDITNRDYKLLLKSRLGRDRTAGQGVHGLRSRFLVVAGDLRKLVAGMNRLTSEPLLDY